LQDLVLWEWLPKINKLISPPISTQVTPEPRATRANVAICGQRDPRWEPQDITTDATCLCTGALMLLIIEQMPSMVQQQAGLPRYATVGFWSDLASNFGCFSGRIWVV